MKMRTIAYWTSTVLVAAECAIGGVMDVLGLPPFTGVMAHLGYPAYFGAILGIWKILGAVAVLAPGVPRLKEWAYAGVFFNMTGAVASHLCVGDGASALVTPTVFTALLVTSWALRPAARGGFTLS